MSIKLLCCLLFIELVTVSSITVQTDDLCDSSLYDVYTLTKQTQWYAAVSDPTHCADGDDATSCVVHFAVCGSLPATVCNNGDQTGFCQIVTNANIVKQYDSGKFESIKYDENGDDEIQLQYLNGTKIGQCNKGIATTVNIQCELTADWESVTDGDVTKFVKKFTRDPSSECSYTMVVNYNGVCTTEIEEMVSSSEMISSSEILFSSSEIPITSSSSEIPVISTSQVAPTSTTLPGSSKLSSWVIVVIVFGCLVFFLILVIIAFSAHICWKKKRNSNYLSDNTANSEIDTATDTSKLLIYN